VRGNVEVVYDEVREEARRMLAALGRTAGCFGDLVEATPSTAHRLGAYAHRAGAVEIEGVDETWVTGKLDALAALGGADLLVPEPALLGRTGIAAPRGLMTLDALRGHETLFAIRRAEILADLWGQARRPVVVQLGGWVGFACQLKTLRPRTTYVLAADPASFVISATYAASAFPGARIQCWIPGDEIEAKLPFDFVFVAREHLPALPVEGVDLCLSFGSFDSVSPGTEEIARILGAIEAPYCYWLMHDRGATDATALARQTLERYYWLREMRVLPCDFATRLPDKRPPRLRTGRDDPAADGELRYRHVVGRRRRLVEGLAERDDLG
jgi:hypothetical protein